MRKNLRNFNIHKTRFTMLTLVVLLAGISMHCDHYERDNPVDGVYETMDNNEDGIPDFSWSVFSTEPAGYYITVDGLAELIVQSIEAGSAADWEHRVIVNGYARSVYFPCAGSTNRIRCVVNFTNSTSSADGTAPVEREVRRAVNGYCFTRLEGGSYTMGAEEYATIAPPHTVTLDPFFIAVTEVTCRMWMSVHDWALAHEYQFDRNLLQSDFVKAHLPELLDTPVVGTVWYEGILFCNALSEKEGRTPVYYTDETCLTVYRSSNNNGLLTRNDFVLWEADGYRLPTEAEWEYACRAGSRTRYFWGDDPAQMNLYVWYRGNAVYDSFDSLYRPAIVGLKQPNAFGLYDVCGNAAEWCWDWYAPYDIQESVNPKGSYDGLNKIARGSDVHESSLFMHSASRGYAVAVSPVLYTGFRLVYKAKD